ncbi:hypothetical protein sos41_21420 [Alphaproteobacteria bacterium SO-S41]|nr:hypothetical protein sos41_21420 [Alphaproteobacteria bacterium SO-S41]
MQPPRSFGVLFLMEADDLRDQLRIIVSAMLKDIDASMHAREAVAMKRRLAAALRDLADTVDPA